MQREILKRTVCEAVDRQADVIVEVGESIMDDPELGFKEERTAQRVKRIFERANLDFKSELALTGVMASLRSSRPGPTVALLGELDALVVPDHPRAATDTGAAHACGHNAQIAGLMGAALALTEAGVIEHLCGNIAFLAVPAEEYVEIDSSILGKAKLGTLVGDASKLRYKTGWAPKVSFNELIEIMIKSELGYD